MSIPLIEVFNVAVFPETLPCYVYGDIHVYDEDHPDEEQTYQLYERDSEHPELICESGQFLLLKSPNYPLTMPKPVISIQLMCKSRDSDVKLVEAKRCLETARDEFEEFKCCKLGEFATVYYVAMARALCADVTISLRPLGVDVWSDTDIAGTVTAYYSTRFLYDHLCPDDPDDDDKSESLQHKFSFTILKTNFVQNCVLDIDGGYLLKLQRPMLAVPAYSSLIIKADLRLLSTNEPFLTGTIFSLATSFSAMSLMASTDDDGNYSPSDITSQYACLMVDWSDPALHLPRPNFSLSYDCFRPSLGEPLLEVYSAYVSRYGHKDVDMLSIHGHIAVRPTPFYNHYIYKRDEGNPDTFPKGLAMGQLSIIDPFCPIAVISCYNFFVLTVRLYDVHHTDLYVQGSAEFDTNMSGEDKLYDKLLSSVISGHGIHCVVHHTNFSRAVRLKVMCSVVSKYSAYNVAGAQVHGRIVAWCNDLDYSFDYHKKYCKRVLFDKSEVDSMLLFQNVSSETTDECNQENISTSYVAMPVGGTLSIDVNVYASANQERCLAECIKGTVQYNLLGDQTMEIEGKKFNILVSCLVFDVGDSPLTQDALIRRSKY